MVEEAVEMLIRMKNWDGLAVLFTQLPSGRFALFACYFPVLYRKVLGHGPS